jgi:hypothetical protein
VSKQQPRRRAGTAPQPPARRRAPFRPASRRRVTVLAVGASVSLVLSVPVLARAVTGADAAPKTTATVAAPLPAAPVVAVPAADTFTNAVTNGDSANDLYAFLAARPHKLVHLDFPASKPQSTGVTAKGKTLTLSSGCTETSTSRKCVDNVNAAGIKISLTGKGVTVAPAASGIYRVQGDALVAPVTRDAKGYYTVPLQGVALDAAAGEDDD